VGLNPLFFLLMNSKLESLVKSVFEKQGFDLVALSLQRRNHKLYLEILADRIGGITLDECVGLNKALAEKIEEDNLIEASYIIDVSSPGIDYPLTEKADFKRKLNRSLSVSFYDQDEKTCSEEGELILVADDYIRLKKNNKKEVDILLGKVIKGKETLGL